MRSSLPHLRPSSASRYRSATPIRYIVAPPCITPKSLPSPEAAASLLKKRSELLASGVSEATVDVLLSNFVSIGSSKEDTTEHKGEVKKLQDNFKELKDNVKELKDDMRAGFNDVKAGFKEQKDASEAHFKEQKNDSEARFNDVKAGFKELKDASEARFKEQKDEMKEMKNCVKKLTDESTLVKVCLVATLLLVLSSATPDSPLGAVIEALLKLVKF